MEEILGVALIGTLVAWGYREFGNGNGRRRAAAAKKKNGAKNGKNGN